MGANIKYLVLPLVIFALLGFSSWANAVLTYDLNTTLYEDLNIIGAAGAYIGRGGIVFMDADNDGNRNDVIVQSAYQGGRLTAGGVIFLIKNIGTKTGPVDLSKATTADLNIYASSSNSFLGGAAICVGDADADGYDDDVVIQDNYADPNKRVNAGAAFLILNIGQETGIIDLNLESGRSRVDLNIYGGAPNDELGAGGCAFGDADADGFNDDLVVGAWGMIAGGISGAGAVFLFKSLASKGSMIDLNTEAGRLQADLNIYGSKTNAALGIGAVVFGDADVDGNRDDLLIGEPSGGTSSAGVVSMILNAGTESGTIKLGNNNTIDANFVGINNSSLGWGGICFGDADADGNKDDVAMSAYNGDPLNRTNAGTIYLIKSIGTKTGEIKFTSTPADLNIFGSVDSDALGRGDCVFGDGDADGYYDDLVTGANGSDPSGRSSAGSGYLIQNAGQLSSATIDLNTTPADITLLGPFTNANLGFGGIDFGDADNDHHDDDLLIQAYQARPMGRLVAGEAWLFLDFYAPTNTRPDVNMVKIDSNRTNVQLAPFSYFRDGNLTIDFNVSDADINGNFSKTLYADIYYSSDRNMFQHLIVDDLNLMAVSTVGNPNTRLYCDDLNFAGSDANRATTCHWDFNISSTLLGSDGNYVIDINVWDALDSNKIATMDYNFMIDNTPPMTYLDMNRSWQKMDANLTMLFGIDANSGIDTNMYRLDTDDTNAVVMGPWQVFDSNILIMHDGNWAVDYNSSDRAGNLEDTNRIYILIDTNAPRVSADYNRQWQKIDANVTFTCTDVNSDCNAIYYRKDTDSSSAVVYGAWTQLASLDGNVLFSSDGNYAMDFNAADNAGNRSDTNTIYVLVDKNSPFVSISSPADGSSQTSTTVTIEYAGSDNNSGIAKYWLSNNGTTWVDNGTNTSYSFTNQANGSHTYHVTANDNADNNSADANVTITISASSGGGPGPYCGDGLCHPWESCSSCPKDCGACPTVPIVNTLLSKSDESVSLQKDYASFISDSIAIIGEGNIDMVKNAKRTATENELKITRGIRIFSLMNSNREIKGFFNIMTLSIENISDKELTGIEILESIPKELVQNASIISSNNGFEILKADPVVMFTADALGAGQSIDVSYDFNTSGGNQAEIESQFNDLAPPAVLVDLQESDACMGVICNDYNACTVDYCLEGKCESRPKCRNNETCDNGTCTKKEAPKTENATMPGLREKPFDYLPVIAIIAVILVAAIAYFILRNRRARPRL